jgi:hypothetical protein
MSLIEKSDVKNHPSARYHKEIYLGRRASQPGATGFSVNELDAENTKQSEFVQDYSAEHAVAGMPVTSAKDSTGFIGPQAPAASKSAQS